MSFKEKYGKMQYLKEKIWITIELLILMIFIIDAKGKRYTKRQLFFELIHK